MLTEYEARTLQRQMTRELDARPETVWWCAACILILLVLLVVAPSMANGC
jgi:hypothetical protein